MPGKHYQRNFLTTVVLKLDLEPLPALQTHAQARTPFTDQVATQFPVILGLPVGTITVNMSPTASGIQQQLLGMQWEHRKTPGGTKALVLGPSHLSLEYGKGDFDHFPPFQADFEVGFNALRQCFPDVHVVRVGLRYVNQISLAEGNPLDWEGIIAAPLVSSVKAALLQGTALARSMHQVHMRNGDVNTLFHYGIVNPEYPAPVTRREFILDLDCYRQEAIALADVLPIVAGLNETCEQVFENSIEDGLRNQLGEIHG